MAFTFEKTIKSPNFDLKIAFDINTRTKNQKHCSLQQTTDNSNQQRLINKIGSESEHNSDYNADDENLDKKKTHVLS